MEYTIELKPLETENYEIMLDFVEKTQEKIIDSFSDWELDFSTDGAGQQTLDYQSVSIYCDSVDFLDLFEFEDKEITINEQKFFLKVSKEEDHIEIDLGVK